MTPVFEARINASTTNVEMQKSNLNMAVNMLKALKVEYKKGGKMTSFAQDVLQDGTWVLNKDGKTFTTLLKDKTERIYSVLELNATTFHLKTADGRELILMPE